MLNNHDGYFAHYPFSGGLMEQPGTTMEILEVCRGEYCAYLEERMPHGGI